MTKNAIELLDSVKHQQLKIDTLLVDTPHNHMNSASVSVSELATLVHEYPIFITKNPNTGQFLFSALLGLNSGQNLFIQNNVWNAKYIPLDVMRRPFQAMLQEEGNFSNGRIAIDIDNPVVQEEKGESLFNEQGEATPFLERIQKTFAQLLGSAEITNKILNIMYQYNLLESVTIKLELGVDKAVNMNGLYTINKSILAKLSGEALEICHKQGVLEVCHLVMSSGAHLDKLIKWQRNYA